MALPFHDRDGFIWMDGKLEPWREANVHVLTHALHYASSVFEGLRCYDGKIFKLREHSLRLINSAEILGFSIPYSVEEIDAACNAAVAAQNIKDGYVRPLAWRGSEQMGIIARNCKIHLAVAAWEWPTYFTPEQKAKGIALKTGPWRRPAPDCAPVHSKAAGLYMISTLSKHWAEDNGADDVLMLDYRGYVAEGSGANLFLVKDGKLHTPIADCFLNGITRQTVMALAREAGIEVVERHIMFDEISSFSEAFFTGTAAEITPIGLINDHKLPPGQMVEKITALYSKATRG
jgi:branched-chain amino acid aminotransferase